MIGQFIRSALTSRTFGCGSFGPLSDHLEEQGIQSKILEILRTPVGPAYGVDNLNIKHLIDIITHHGTPSEREFYLKWYRKFVRQMKEAARGNNEVAQANIRRTGLTRLRFFLLQYKGI